MVIHSEIEKAEFKFEKAFCPNGQVLQDEPNASFVVIVFQPKCRRCKTTYQVPCELASGGWGMRPDGVLLVGIMVIIVLVSMMMVILVRIIGTVVVHVAIVVVMVSIIVGGVGRRKGCVREGDGCVCWVHHQILLFSSMPIPEVY